MMAGNKLKLDFDFTEFKELLRDITSEAFAAKLHPQPGKRHVLQKPLPKKPDISEKIQAATHISTMGIHHSGIRTQATLMWPLTEFNEYDVELMAARFLGSLLTALLPTVPPQQIDKLWKLQDEYLSFVEEPVSPDDKSHKKVENCDGKGGLFSVLTDGEVVISHK